MDHGPHAPWPWWLITVFVVSALLVLGVLAASVRGLTQIL